jgi:hypothetical protein
MIFLAYHINSWKLTNFLVWLHFCQKVRSDGQIMPTYIPNWRELTSPLFDTPIWIFNNFDQLELVHFSCCLFHYIIFGTVNIDDYSILVLSLIKELIHIMILFRIFRCSFSLFRPLVTIILVSIIIIFILFPIIVIFLFLYLRCRSCRVWVFYVLLKSIRDLWILNI